MQVRTLIYGPITSSIRYEREFGKSPARADHPFRRGNDGHSGALVADQNGGYVHASTMDSSHTK